MAFTAVGGVALHHVFAGRGAGAPLVFVNALGSDYRIWDEVAARLHRPSVRYDKRGHGLSSCPAGPYTVGDHGADLLGLLERCGLQQAILVGISVGGLIALEVAARQPERVAALVLCDTALQIGSSAFWEARIAAVRARGLAAAAADIVPRWFAPSFAAAQPAAFQGYLAMLRQMPEEGYVATCQALRDADLRPLLGRIRARALVLAGAEDAATPPDLGRALAAALPDARFAVIENAGHLPCVEQPAAVAAHIAAFLEEDMADETLERGTARRKAVLGEAHVARAVASTTPFDEDFQAFITRYAWGEVWQRPALGTRERHLVTLAMLAALGKEHEFALHVRATRNTGVSQDELEDVLHQVAVYAGLPAANTAFGIAKRVYGELEREEA